MSPADVELEVDSSKKWEREVVKCWVGEGGGSRKRGQEAELHTQGASLEAEQSREITVRKDTCTAEGTESLSHVSLHFRSQPEDSVLHDPPSMILGDPCVDTDLQEEATGSPYFLYPRRPSQWPKTNQEQGTKDGRFSVGTPVRRDPDSRNPAGRLSVTNIPVQSRS